MAKQKIESIPIDSDWGVPDWRDASAYPSVQLERDPKTHHDQYWKWEFLRRDPKYRQDWEKHRKKDHPKLLALSIEDDHEEDFDVEWYPEDHQDLWPEVWRLIRTYGLARLPHPSLSHPNHVYFHTVPGLEALISIDLKQSLQPQLDHYLPYLQIHQKHYCKKLKRTREVDRQKWPLLLRVLDARAEGLEFYQIGLKLLGRLKKEAKDVVNGYGQAEFNTARKMWKKIIPPSRLVEGLELSFEDGFMCVFPPDMPRRILPVLYP